MYNLKNKVVLITGAAGVGGLGSGVVRLLMEEKVKHVAILDVAKAAGEAFQDELNAKYGANKVKFYLCDVTDEEACIRVMNDVKTEQGYIDLVINNAGIMNDSWPMFKKQILVNVLGLVTVSLRALELMRRDEGGHGGTIINIASVAAITQEPPILPVYSATKSAVLQFSNQLGKEYYYGRSGVRVIAVCPGATDTTLLSPQKAGSFDKSFDKLFGDVVGAPQKLESVAKGVIDAYKRGESGSTWVVTRDQPATDITADIKKAYDALAPYALI